MAYRKNKRRFDPRYFMNERMEQLDELQPGDPGVGGSSIIGRKEKEENYGEEEEFPGGTIEDLPKAVPEDEVRNKYKNNFKEGCGDVEELPWVEIDGGKLTASNDSEQSLADIVKTGQAWKDMGIEIIGGREDVLSALGVELPGEQISWLADEEPALEE